MTAGAGAGRPPRDGWDAIVVGGGHNGLVAGGLLARAGLATLVLEARERLGGAADTSEIVPGARVPTLAHTVGRLRPSVARELRLREHGLRLVAPDIAAFVPDADGEGIALWRDPASTSDGLRHRSRRDADAILDLDGRIRSAGRLLAHLARTTPPDLRRPAGADVLAGLRLARAGRGLEGPDVGWLTRVFPMAIADVVEDAFELDGLRAAVALRGVLHTAMGPRSAGTASVLLQDSAGNDGGAVGQTVFARGGPGALADALAAAARSFGAQVRAGASVAGITSEDGRTTGVVMADGEQVVAPIVVAAIEPKRLLTGLVDPMDLGPTLRWRAGNYRTPGGVAKVNLALARLPRFAGGGDEQARILRGRILLASSVDDLDRAFNASKYGGLPASPPMELTIPSLVDPDLVSESARRRGVEHVLSAIVQDVPYSLVDGAAWEDQREALGDVVVRTLETYAPGIASLVVERQILTPVDLESQYGLTGGHALHGEPGLDQFFAWRPLLGWARYRMPLVGLYLAGAGAHPGGGITGAPAENAVREILADRRSGVLEHAR